MLLHYEPTLCFINYALNNNDKSNYSSKCYQLTGQTSYYWHYLITMSADGNFVSEKPGMN